MRSLVLLAVGMAAVAAGSATAQSALGASPFAPESRALPLSAAPPSFSFRVSDVIHADGSRRKRTSIIAGVEVARDTTIGFGLFNAMPKARGRGPDPRLDGLARKPRRAAIGMTFRF